MTTELQSRLDAIEKTLEEISQRLSRVESVLLQADRECVLLRLDRLERALALSRRLAYTTLGAAASAVAGMLVQLLR